MLVLTRKPGEVIHAGPVAVSVLSVEGRNRVKLGVDAPRYLPVLRGELIVKQRPEIASTLEDIVRISLQPGFRQDKELMFATLSAAVSMLAAKS